MRMKVRKTKYLKYKIKNREEISNISSFLVNYSWINQKNTIFRSLPPEFIIEHSLKIEIPDFDTLRNWIIDEKNDISQRSINTKEEKKIRKKLKKKIYTKSLKGEDTIRLLRDFSPCVGFKSDQHKRTIKLSRFELLNRLKRDISSKYDEMFGSAIQINRGLFQTSLNLHLALNELRNNIQDKSSRDINVISFLNSYVNKNNISPQCYNYGIIRGLMQDILFIESNGNRLRGGLNVFHLMTLLGWKDAFKFEGLCLYFETLINNLVIGIKSFIERIWRFTHDFSDIRYINQEIKREFLSTNQSLGWITSLEILFSIINKIEQEFNFKEFIAKDPSINLNFDFNNAVTLFLLNSLRNTYTHSSPESISGVEKEVLIVQKISEIQKYEIFNLYIASTPLIKNLENRDFLEYLNVCGYTSSNIDINNVLTQNEIIKYRIKWRIPNIINDMLDNINSPGIYEDFPKNNIIGVEFPELKEFYPCPRKILIRKSSPIKEVGDQNMQKISIFNLSDCLESLFIFFKNLLKLYIINKIEINH